MAERGEGACGCSGKEEDRLRGRRKIKGAAVETKGGGAAVSAVKGEVAGFVRWEAVSGGRAKW